MTLRASLQIGALVVLGSALNAQITGSAHDFSTEAWNPGGEICQPCHTPHKGAPLVAGSPGLLWNHELTTTTFNMYSSPTIDGVVSAQPGSTSLMCLSCHDGTVGLGDFGGVTGTPVLTGSTLVGVDLHGGHPISVTYDPVADPYLHPTSNTLGGTQTILSVLEGGVLECSGCHDVHNSPSEVFGPYLLRDTLAGSQLCLDCHNF